MSTLIMFAVKITLLVAIGQRWSWIPALLLFLALFVKAKRKFGRFGPIDYDSFRTWFRIVVDIMVLVAGFIAISTVWGTIWTAAILIIYVIGVAKD